MHQHKLHKCTRLKCQRERERPREKEKRERKVERSGKVTGLVKPHQVSEAVEGKDSQWTDRCDRVEIFM